MSFGNPQIFGAAGSDLAPTPNQGPNPSEWIPPQLQCVATTGPTGFALQDATPTILSWTAPSDGNLHRVIIPSTLVVTSALTGGAIVTNMGGNARQILAGGQGVGTWIPGAGAGSNYVATVVVLPGQTITLSQYSAVTAGAATLYAEIWAS